MSVTLTYDSQLSRVRVAATSLGDALTALVERSTNQIAWTTVRGGVDVPVTSGTMQTVDDYEFDADVINYYRVTYTAEMSFIASGTAAHGNNASVAPGVPGGTLQGDTMFLLAAIRNSGTGVPDIPSGWSLLVDAGNMRLFAKPAGSSESAPTVSFTGGVANADTSAQIATFRGVDPNPVGVPATQLNVSAQDIAVPGIALGTTLDGGLNLWLGWKQDDWTSVGLVTNGTEIGEPSTTTGDDQGIVWDYRVIAKTTSFDNLTTRTFTVTGGASAISRGAVAVFQHSLANQSNSITPSLGGATWLKFIARPFLNTIVTPYGELEWTRRSRNGVFEVVGRSNRVAVTDARLSREGQLLLKVDTVEGYERLDLVLLGGDSVFLHTPPGSRLPTMYADVGDVQVSSPVPDTYFFTLPLIQVSAPAPEIVGATSTFQTLVNNYDTFAEVLATFATFQAVLEEIAQPGDIEVP